MIDLTKDIQTVKVTNDPNSYSTLVYGEVKIGKSTFVKDLYGKKALFLMTENRERGLVGADVIKVTNWTDFLTVLDQLGRVKDLKEKYDVIVVDTVDELKRFVENYAKSQYDEDELGENAGFGKDYKFATDQWENNLPRIHDAGFTPIFVGHDKKITEKIPAEEMDKNSFDGNAELVSEKGGNQYYEFEKAVPDLPTKYMNPINKSVDQILYLSRMYDKNGQEQRVIHLRNSAQWIAGSTFSNIKPLLKLKADSYRKALNQAVNSFSENDRTDDNYNTAPDKKPFKELFTEAKDLGNQLYEQNPAAIGKVSESVFGKNSSLKNATEKQYEQVSLFVYKVKQELSD